MSGKPPPDVLAEFTARMHAAMEAFGAEFEAGPLLAEFQDRGVSRTTVYRWKAAAMASGRRLLKAQKKADKAAKPAPPTKPAPPEPPAPAVREPAAPAAPAPPKPPAPATPALVPETPPAPCTPEGLPIAVADVAARLPPIPRLEDVRTMGVLPTIELLADCIRHTQDLITHARAKDGAVRNARLLMQASEHLRRAVETAARLNETVAIQRDMERFHETCLEEIGKESPPVQERILNRLRRAADEVLNDGL